MPTSIENRLKELESVAALQEYKLNELDRQALFLALKEIKDAKLLYEVRSQKRTMEDSLNYMRTGCVFISGLGLGVFLAVLLI
ncbi:hypothetical protein [Vibrio campbellii]|uniref:hypothetical protein n=1 Tax=Vibrio campbellii TaxID=680 RepID=UPI001F3B61B8|nr:hypothetical protein [Vibrio campbellii]MCE7729654.1 hypothetical protein [Vibrio campbellii]